MLSKCISFDIVLNYYSVYSKASLYIASLYIAKQVVENQMEKV